MESELTMDQIREMIPQDYKFIKVISSGGFGQVLSCLKKDTREIVAVKLPYYEQDTEEEIRLLHRLMDQGSDQRHIVKFFGEFNTSLGKGMIFERLGVSLVEFWDMYKPLPLLDISTITKQVAIALEVLKDMSVIHADLKWDNVMVRNHTQRPLHIKLIDFGLAMPTARAKPGMRIQHACYRPPEVILGLPFNEAVDVWTLGTMMASFMLHGDELFPNRSEYETLKVIVKLFGTPSRFHLDKGTKTQQYFRRHDRNWVLKNEQEIDNIDAYLPDVYYTESFRSLRNLMEIHSIGSSLEENRDLEAATLLLGRMLEIDPEKRITPSEILQHPFICEELESSSVPSAWIQWGIKSENRTATLPKGFRVIEQLENGKFGQVFKCRRLDTWETVTVKLPNSSNRTQHEVKLLERFAENETDQQNIVTFVEMLQSSRGEALVLEELTMSLARYVKQYHPLPMSDVRAIVQQTATALQTLKSMGIIHTGVMLENIWLCHRSNESIKIKLADFGAFIEQKRALPGMTTQQVHYRAPEIILGLPFDQAIDVWSLGCMLVKILIKYDLFPKGTEFETLRTMIKLFGQPPDSVLNKAIKTHEFFKPVGNSWKLMTPREFEKSSVRPRVNVKIHDMDIFDFLDEIIEFLIPSSHSYGNTELAACINLIKAMLNMDGTQRITPAQILEHNFIRLSREVTEPVPEEQVDSVQTPMKSPAPQAEPVPEEQVDSVQTPMKSPAPQAEPVPEEQVDSVQTPMFIMIRPASSENTTPFVDDYQVSQSVVSPAAARTVDIEPVQEERPKTTEITVTPASSGDVQVLEQEELQSGRRQSKMEATPDTEVKTKMSKPRFLITTSKNIVSGKGQPAM